MKINTANTTPTPLSTAGCRLALLALAALLLQGCTTARTAWSYPADTNLPTRSAYERPATQEGIALVNFKF